MVGVSYMTENVGANRTIVRPVMPTVEWAVRVMGGLQRESAADDVAGEGAAALRARNGAFFL